MSSIAAKEWAARMTPMLWDRKRFAEEIDLAVAPLVTAIEELLNDHDGQCRFDHHGGCQAHGDMTGDLDCFVKQARKALAQWRNEDEL